MPTSTYTALATVTLGGSDNSITFSSIPATYRDLVLVIGSAKSASGNPAVVARFNSDSGTNYPYVRMTGNGSSAGTFASTGDSFLNLAAAFGINTTENATIILQVFDYSVATKHRPVLVRSNLAGSGVEGIHARWANSSNAITQIELFNTSSLSFATGTTFNLFGIAS